MEEQYKPQAIEQKVQADWEKSLFLTAWYYRGKVKILLPVDVPLSSRQTAHGACAQLHHRRCDEPLSPYEGLASDAAYGLGCVWTACGKRRHGRTVCILPTWTYSNIELHE